MFTFQHEVKLAAKIHCDSINILFRSLKEICDSVLMLVR